MVISFTFISSMILVKQAVFPVPGAPEMYKLPGFPFGRWLCRNDLISAISFSRHSKLSGCEECSALLTLEYWWPLKIGVSYHILLWYQFYFNNVILVNARFLVESIAEGEENKTIIVLSQNEMHREWLILPFLFANTAVELDKKGWSHKHILAILTPSSMQIPYEFNFLFSLGTSAPGMHPRHFYMYMGGKSLLKSSHPTKYLANFPTPKKSRNQKFQTPKNPLIILVTWNLDYPPGNQYHYLPSWRARDSICFAPGLLELVEVASVVFPLLFFFFEDLRISWASLDDSGNQRGWITILAGL